MLLIRRLELAFIATCVSRASGGKVRVAEFQGTGTGKKELLILAAAISAMTSMSNGPSFFKVLHPICPTTTQRRNKQ